MREASVVRLFVRMPLFLALPAVLLLPGCGGGDDGNGGVPTATATATIAPTETATTAPTATSTQTPRPTATATPIPTATATATSTPTATATATPTPTATIQQGTLIEIADGMVQGDVEGGARRFLGIPFAKPPIGNRRWRPPRKPDVWTDVRQTTEMSQPCAQVAGITTPASDNEDCLYLNVWSIDPAPSEPLPVMVWFHGGGNTGGSTADLIPLGVGGLFYNGRSLAVTRGVIVVTANYRLNIFGFLSHPELSAEDPEYPFSGNQGLLDQRFALEWVRDNIAAFGGDPSNVTIFGESAGSFDVCCHVASPLSRGLFHRAISESGGCTTRQPTVEQAQQRTQALIEAVDCDEAPDSLACLRSKPVSLLLDNLDGFEPIVDGGFLPDQPRALYDSGNFAQVPYILGSNSDEGTLFLLAGPPVETEEEYLAALQARFGDRADEVAAVYPVANFANPRDALARVVGDSGLVCSTYDSARRAAAGGADVYLYNFARPVLTDVIPFLRATHGAEIAYVFGSAEAPAPEDSLLSLQMQNYWTLFARTGDPNDNEDLVWPLYTDATDQRINFDVEKSILTGFRRTECELWWGFYDEDFEK